MRLKFNKKLYDNSKNLNFYYSYFEDIGWGTSFILGYQDVGMINVGYLLLEEKYEIYKYYNI